jgi:hypothetical protein
MGKIKRQASTLIIQPKTVDSSLIDRSENPIQRIHLVAMGQCNSVNTKHPIYTTGLASSSSARYHGAEPKGKQDA